MAMISHAFDREASFLRDPQWEPRTEDEKTRWQAYLAASKLAWDKYDRAELKAREYYLSHRRGWIRGIFQLPSIWKMLYPWPTEELLDDFDKSELGQLKEYEKMIFLAARTFALEERNARFEYWTAA
jgi:hypothetical protein